MNEHCHRARSSHLCIFHASHYSCHSNEAWGRKDTMLQTGPGHLEVVDSENPKHTAIREHWEKVPCLPSPSAPWLKISSSVMVYQVLAPTWVLCWVIDTTPSLTRCQSIWKRHERVRDLKEHSMWYHKLREKKEENHVVTSAIHRCPYCILKIVKIHVIKSIWEPNSLTLMHFLGGLELCILCELWHNERVASTVTETQACWLPKGN